MRTHDFPLLLEKIDPSVRLTLVRCRTMAMRGEQQLADDTLREEISRQGSSGNPLNVVAVAMLRAELLRLDGRDGLALEQFDFVISPSLKQLDMSIQFVVEQNHINLRISQHNMDSPKAVTDFYHLFDRRQAADIEWSNYLSIAIAQEALEEDDHRKAFSNLWKEVVRTYRQACWNVHDSAIRRLGHEWLRIGEPINAVHCAILAKSDNLARSVGDELLARKDPVMIEQIIAGILLKANLQKHFCTACEFLHHVGDVIPDKQIESVAEWLLKRCSIPQENHGTSGPLYRAWRALQVIAHRLGIDLARRAVFSAVSHPIWRQDLPLLSFSWVAREQMVMTVKEVVEVLPIGDLESLAREVIPLARERMKETDYDDVISLLCHIVYRSNDEIREFIGSKLYEPGQKMYHILGQVAHIFKQQYLSTERLNQQPMQVARVVRLQVQRKSKGQPFEVVPGSIFQSTFQTEDEAICTSVVGLMDWYAVARHRDQVSKEGLQEMVSAAIDMLDDPANDMANRVSLIAAMMELGDVLDASTIDNVIDILEPLARGEIKLTSEHKKFYETNIKLSTNSLEDLRSIALVGIAKLGGRFPDRYRKRMATLLEDALCDLHVEIRRGAFAAFRDFPIQSKGPLLAVLLGTRDSDPAGAMTAFAALADKPALTLNQIHWRLLLYSVRLASQSKNSDLRWHAARTLSQLIGRLPKGTIRNQAEEILALFHSDISSRVRSAARRNGIDSAARFADLAAQWRADTEFVSSPVEMVNHPAYREIIAMGEPAVPLILAELEARPDFWFAALREITGEDPVPLEARGNVRAMAEAWLEWGHSHGRRV